MFKKLLICCCAFLLALGGVAGGMYLSNYINDKNYSAELNNQKADLSSVSESLSSVQKNFQNNRVGTK